MKWTIDFLRKSGMIAYEYRRGSHMYHLNTPQSDEDTGGVFICPPSMLEGLRSEYVEQVADEKNDTVFYEFGRWIELLCKSNPTALESLFAQSLISSFLPAIYPPVGAIEAPEFFISEPPIRSAPYAVGSLSSTNSP